MGAMNLPQNSMQQQMRDLFVLAGILVTYLSYLTHTQPQHTCNITKSIPVSICI